LRSDRGTAIRSIAYGADRLNNDCSGNNIRGKHLAHTDAMATSTRTPPAARRVDAPRAAGRFYRGDDYRIEESIGYLMRVALAGLKRDAELELQAHGMTSEQALPLLAVSQGLCNTGADLARLYDMDPGAVTRMLDRIEAKGLIERVRRSDDRRVVEVKLTRSGQALAARIPKVLADTLNGVLRGFSHAEVEQLKGMLRRITANTRSNGASPVASGSAREEAER
jgi:DNA-binding MarR family transcriptional regulator